MGRMDKGWGAYGKVVGRVGGKGEGVRWYGER